MELHKFRCLTTYLPTYTHTPAYLPTYLPACLPAYLPTYLPTYLPVDLPTYRPTDRPTYLPTYLPTDLPTYLHKIILRTANLGLPLLDVRKQKEQLLDRRTRYLRCKLAVLTLLPDFPKRLRVKSTERNLRLLGLEPAAQTPKANARVLRVEAVRLT